MAIRKTLTQERDTETDNGYENRARRIARQLGLKIKIVEEAVQDCPPWRGEACDHIHGLRYRVTLIHHGSIGSLSFNFWSSQHDRERGKKPGYYDIMSCLSSDASMPTDPDEVVKELGAMPPSQAIRAASFARRLQAFFTEAELVTLSLVS